MRTNSSRLLECEKTSWMKEYFLEINPTLAIVLNEVCGMLESDTSISLEGLQIDRPMANALGFHPNASYKDICHDREILLQSTCEPTFMTGMLNMDKRIRIRMDPSMCTIL